MAVDILTKPLPKSTPPEGLFTFDEICSLIREGQKADLIDGVIYMASPATLDHDDLFGFLLIIVRSYVRRKN